MSTLFRSLGGLDSTGAPCASPPGRNARANLLRDARGGFFSDWLAKVSIGVFGVISILQLRLMPGVFRASSRTAQSVENAAASPTRASPPEWRAPPYAITDRGYAVGEPPPFGFREAPCDALCQFQRDIDFAGRFRRGVGVFFEQTWNGMRAFGRMILDPTGPEMAGMGRVLASGRRLDQLVGDSLARTWSRWWNGTLADRGEIAGYVGGFLGLSAVMELATGGASSALQALAPESTMMTAATGRLVLLEEMTANGIVVTEAVTIDAAELATTMGRGATAAMNVPALETTTAGVRAARASTLPPGVEARTETGFIKRFGSTEGPHRVHALDVNPDRIYLVGHGSADPDYAMARVRANGQVYRFDADQLARNLAKDPRLVPDGQLPIVCDSCQFGNAKYQGMPAGQHIANVTNRHVYAPKVDTNGVWNETRWEPSPAVFLDDGKLNATYWEHYVPAGRGELGAGVRVAHDPFPPVPPGSCGPECYDHAVSEVLGVRPSRDFGLSVPETKDAQDALAAEILRARGYRLDTSGKIVDLETAQRIVTQNAANGRPSFVTVVPQGDTLSPHILPAIPGKPGGWPVWYPKGNPWEYYHPKPVEGFVVDTVHPPTAPPAAPAPAPRKP